MECCQIVQFHFDTFHFDITLQTQTQVNFDEDEDDDVQCDCSAVRKNTSDINVTSYLCFLLILPDINESEDAFTLFQTH